MIFGIPNTRAMFTSSDNNIFNYERLQDRISSALKYILESEKEEIQSESVTFTEEEKARLTAPFFGDSNEMNEAELVHSPEGLSYKQESFPFVVHSYDLNKTKLACSFEELSSIDEEESVSSFGDSNETNKTELTCSSEELSYLDKEEFVSNTSRSLIGKIMIVWNKYTKLSYLSEKLDTLVQDHKVRLYTYTAGLIFKESDSGVRKIVQILSSLSGITHISLITTLFLDKLLPSSKKV